MLAGVIKGDNESIIRFRWDTDRSLSRDYRMHFSCIRKDGTKGELEESGAHSCITHPSELISILNN
jgi:hypothetical protein